MTNNYNITPDPKNPDHFVVEYINEDDSISTFVIEDLEFLDEDKKTEFDELCNNISISYSHVSGSKLSDDVIGKVMQDLLENAISKAEEIVNE